LEAGRAGVEKEDGYKGREGEGGFKLLEKRGEVEKPRSGHWVLR